MKEIVLGIWLGALAGVDLKNKEIPVWVCGIASIVGIGFCIMERRGVDSIVLSMIPGGVSLCFSKLTKEVIGYGDGIVFLAMAFYVSLSKLLSYLMIAFLLAGVVALVLLAVFHKRGKERIPFIPFLFVAFLMEAVIETGGMRM